jgi:GNAT superfamily N-acetyltransferase
MMRLRYHLINKLAGGVRPNPMQGEVPLRIIQVHSQEGIQQVKFLFSEYASSLDFDLSFQNFKNELADLPGEYSAPGGAIFLAYYEGSAAGCVAMRKLAEDVCEMKRLYVRQAFRGKKIGKALSVAIIEEARKRGFSRMRLDTVPSMKEAIKLYRTLGFKETSPYRYNPRAGAMFLELVL